MTPTSAPSRWAHRPAVPPPSYGYHYPPPPHYTTAPPPPPSYYPNGMPSPTPPYYHPRQQPHPGYAEKNYYPPAPPAVHDEASALEARRRTWYHYDASASLPPVAYPPAHRHSGAKNLSPPAIKSAAAQDHQDIASVETTSDRARTDETTATAKTVLHSNRQRDATKKSDQQQDPLALLASVSSAQQEVPETAKATPKRGGGIAPPTSPLQRGSRRQERVHRPKISPITSPRPSALLTAPVTSDPHAPKTITPISSGPRYYHSVQPSTLPPPPPSYGEGGGSSSPYLVYPPSSLKYQPPPPPPGRQVSDAPPPFYDGTDVHGLASHADYAGGPPTFPPPVFRQYQPPPPVQCEKDAVEDSSHKERSHVADAETRGCGPKDARRSSSGDSPPAVVEVPSFDSGDEAAISSCSSASARTCQSSLSGGVSQRGRPRLVAMVKNRNPAPSFQGRPPSVLAMTASPRPPSSSHHHHAPSGAAPPPSPWSHGRPTHHLSFHGSYSAGSYPYGPPPVTTPPRSYYPPPPRTTLPYRPQPSSLSESRGPRDGKADVKEGRFSPYTNIQRSKHDTKSVTMIRKKFSWKGYPELERFLIANRHDYLRHSSKNYTIEQKQYNNWLTEQLLKVADKHNYMFDPTEFNFVAIRDRIRCYYKSFVQTARKRGLQIVPSHDEDDAEPAPRAMEHGLGARGDHEPVSWKHATEAGSAAEASIGATQQKSEMRSSKKPRLEGTSSDAVRPTVTPPVEATAARMKGKDGSD